MKSYFDNWVEQKNMYNEGPSTERVIYSYEDQISTLLSLANRLEDSVRPFSETEGLAKSAGDLMPIRTTKLGQNLDNVINRFESIIKRIQP